MESIHNKGNSQSIVSLLISATFVTKMAVNCHCNKICF